MIAGHGGPRLLQQQPGPFQEPAAIELGREFPLDSREFGLQWFRAAVAGGGGVIIGINAYVKG